MEKCNVGLIDVDGHNYPNLPLMKLSAWHKQQGDHVEWYEPFKALANGEYDKVYMSKVFLFSHDYAYPVYAKEIQKGGSGYCISIVESEEVFDEEKDIQLPYEVEHIYPDYSLYPDMTKDTVYGFLTRGCPRGCSFCHVGAKEGLCSNKVANLSEFWHGQKNIVLCDPNILACREWRELLQQLIDSNAYVDFNQGIDIRLMTEERAIMLKQIKVNSIHFAWDRYQDKDMILPKFELFKRISGLDKRKLIVYILVNFDTTIEQDLDRIYTLRNLGYHPYVMIYNKESLMSGSVYRRLQRWVNNRIIWDKCQRFEDYVA